MIRVISSPSRSTTGLTTLILAMELAIRSERGERGVQRGARPHRGRRLGGIGQVVTARVDRLGFRGGPVRIYLWLVSGERLGQRFEAGLQRRILGLRGQRLRPVQGEVEMAAAIVELADL